MNMTATLDNSYHLLYKQALIDPTQLTEDKLLGLLLKYPYSQPLVFAYERRKKLLNQETPNKELALLYAHSESWLMNYVNKPVGSFIEESASSFVPSEEKTNFTVEDSDLSQEFLQDEEVEFVVGEGGSEVVAENDEENLDETETPLYDNVAETDEGNVGFDDDTVEEEQEEFVQEEEENSEELEDSLALDRLVQEGSVGANYFVFDSFEKVEESSNEEIQVTQEKDDVSLYNDELMPYSFRWWLHKTRLEHADTYQPYVSTNALIQSKPKLDVGVIENSILDQQIKENIIHFQNPEEKLSDEVKRKPVVPVPPKKGAEIIERFIQKDPIIHPLSAENINNENMARQSAEDNYIFVTETLANIYIDQGLYLKAKEVFNKLILKYPEKKSYFATRIQELEKNS
ncbi:hypothetical protein [Sphingobacterium bovistauri]|uniref:Tetratricopeptide repeat protein n=1 Tax=Sphingobacterium bovistauri TaxID=2781959 RepID=A0ABS7Z777_9SPHI|nr:hypothetical protein [Sphingobacterium bovistauri]MCA5006019.1 hypothetical protein [Sphingobacterium bovistauri]